MPGCEQEGALTSAADTKESVEATLMVSRRTSSSESSHTVTSVSLSANDVRQREIVVWTFRFCLGRAGLVLCHRDLQWVARSFTFHLL